jgi:hypothetical protein
MEEAMKVRLAHSLGEVVIPDILWRGNLVDEAAPGAALRDKRPAKAAP